MVPLLIHFIGLGETWTYFHFPLLDILRKTDRLLTFLVFTAVIVIFGFSIDCKIPIDTYQLSFTCQWCRSDVIRVNIQQISHIVLVFTLLTLK